MKISITDKFLWEVYNFLETAGDIADTAFKRPALGSFLQEPKNPIYKKYRDERGRRKFNKLMYYLKRKGYVRSKNLENKKGFILTNQGIDKALKASFKISKPRRKDGKWAMLIFDVPQKHKKARDLMRSILQNLGYKMFQKSVWITPYDVSEKTEKLLQLHSLENYVKIFLIEEI